MNRLKNYTGQLRLYSLSDLVLLLIAARIPNPQLLGGLALWVGFLLFLENGHRHKNRTLFPPYLWLAFWIVGVWLFPWIFALTFILLSVLYTQKKKGYWGLASPLTRGFQSYVLVAAAQGLGAPLALLAGVLTMVRNVLGDVRDTNKDREEGLKTWPVVLRLRQPAFPIHLVGVIATTVTWWYLTGLSPIVLVAVILIEVISYNWTPR